MFRRTRFQFATLLALALAHAGITGDAAAQSNIVGWGEQRFDSRWSTEPFAAIRGGGRMTAALRGNGSAVVWGSNSYQQCNVPVLPAGLAYVELAAGDEFVLGRRSDGSVVGWGNNQGGQLAVPGLPAGLGYVQLSAGWRHGLARRSDGSAVG